MSDRILLLNEIDERAARGELRVPEPTKRAVWDGVSQALTQLALIMPLSFARSLPNAQKQVLRNLILEVVPPKDQKTLSAAWEPARGTLDAAAQVNLRRDNLELLMGEREPYAKLPDVSLVEARSFPESRKSALRTDIERIAPVKDLKALLKAWDKAYKLPGSATRKAITARLIGLLDGSVQAQAAAGGTKRKAADPDLVTA